MVKLFHNYSSPTLFWFSTFVVSSLYFWCLTLVQCCLLFCVSLTLQCPHLLFPPRWLPSRRYTHDTELSYPSFLPWLRPLFSRKAPLLSLVFVSCPFTVSSWCPEQWQHGSGSDLERILEAGSCAKWFGRWQKLGLFVSASHCTGVPQLNRLEFHFCVPWAAVIVWPKISTFSTF